MQVPIDALIGKIQTLVDGSIRIVLDTRELPKDQMTDLFAMRGGEVRVFMAQGETLKVPTEPINNLNAGRRKSPSERLRASLWHLWDKTGDKTRWPDFDPFYAYQVERIIESLNQKLNP